MKIKLYADENFPKSVIEELRKLDHDVLTAFEAGQANQRIPDTQVLAYAIQQERAVITQNRNDFIRLHKATETHTGIIVCKEDHKHPLQLAQRIHIQLLTHAPLNNKLIRINKLLNYLNGGN
jgi:predicted nuclease of predicted toxin-antitoxin system